MAKGVENVTSPFLSEKISVDAFAEGIKENYPEYKNVENKALTKAILEKYPEYESKVETPYTNEEARDVREEQERKKKIFTESSSAGETNSSTAELQAGDKLASYTQQLDSKLNQAQPTEEDFFTGTFGNILRGFDKIIPIGLGDWIDDMSRAAVAGHFQGIAAENSSDLLKAGSLATHEEIQEFLKANEKAASLGASEEMQEFQKIYQENGEGMKGVVMGLLNSGATIVPELIISSLVSMFSNTDSLAAGGTAIGIGAARGAIVGSAAGGVGAAPGAIAGAASAIPYAFGAATAALESGATFAELLQEEAGENVRLDEAKVRAILNDKEAYTRIRNKAVTRGLTIGVIDTITGKLGGSASKLITARSAAKSASGVVSKKGFTQATAASTLIEGIGGSAGEATARAVIGQEMDVSEIALEGIAELPGGIRNVVATQISSPKYYVNGKRVNAETVDSLIETMIPEDLAKADIVIKNDFEGRQNKIDNKVKKYKVSSEVKKSSPNLSDKQVEEVTNLQTELDSLEGKKSEASKKRSSEIKEKINEILENPEGATTPPAKKKKTKPAPEETTDEEAIEELNKEGKAATKENIENKKKEKFVQAQVISAEEADANAPVTTDAQVITAEEADAQAPVTTDAEVITAEEADAMSVKLPNGNEYVIDSKGNITNKKSGKAIKRTSVTGKSVLKASEEVKAKKPATPKKTTKKPVKTKETPKQTQEQAVVPEDSEAVTSADMSVLNLVLKDAKEGQVEELNGKKYTVKNGEIVNFETGKKVVVGTPATKKTTTKKPATKKADTKTEEKPKEVSYRNNVYLVNPDGTITNKKTGKSINPKSVTGKAVLKKLSETQKETKKPTTKKTKTKKSETKEAKVEEKKETPKKTDTKKIEQAKRKNEKINESAPRSKYKRLKVELLRTTNGYTTVLEKTDKRTKKVTRYEFDVFVNAKTGAVTHSVTEFVDGKKKDTKELKDAKGFIDAVNKRVAAGAVVSKSFQSQIDAQLTKDEKKAELERVVPFKEKKEKSYTKRITKYTYKNSKGEEVVVTITSYTGQKERGMPAAKITFSDKRKDTEIGSKQQLDVFVGKLKRRNNIKVELVSESKKTIGKTETLSEDLKSTEPILPEVAKKSKRKPRAKKLPSNVKPFKRTIVKARTDFEPAVFKILLPDGSEVFFQKQIDGKIEQVKLIEGTRDEYGSVKDSKSYDSIREAISDFKKKSEAETKTETKTEKKTTPKKSAPKKPATKKEAPKKTFKEIAKEKKAKEKAEVNDEVNQIENEIEYLDSENVNLNEEIQIEKGNISEAKKVAREKIDKVKKSKKSAAKKAEAIEEIKAELQDEVDDLNGNIENYREDIKANKSEIKKLSRQKEKVKKKIESEKAQERKEVIDAVNAYNKANPPSKKKGKERSRLLTDEEVDATIENEQVKESVNRARRILRLFSPNVRIVIHQSRKAFDEAMARESVNGVASGVEAGRYIQNKNTGVKEIHINLENATATTAIHEAFHAFFDTAYGQDPNIARALAGRLYSALRRGGIEDRRIAFKLQKFIKQYKDVDVQSEEMLAELAAIMSESNAVLSKPVIIKLANLIKDFLISTAKKLKIDNRFVRLLEFEQKQRMEEAEAIEFMKSFVNAVEDSSVNPIQNPIASMPQFKSQDYDLKDMLVEMSNLTENTENKIGGMVVDFFEKGQIIKKAIKSGQITTGHKLEELNNKMFLMHQPDNAAVNTIRDNKGNTIGNAFGGVLFPMKFEGAFWASTRAKAQEMAQQLNRMLELDGKIRMVLTAAPLDKLLSSTVVARNVSSVLNNYADRLGLSERNRLKIQRTKYELLFKGDPKKVNTVNYFDRYSELNLKSKTQKLTSNEKKILRERRALYNSMEKVGLIEVKELKNGKLKLIKKKFNTSQEYESRFDALLDPDNSTFDTRKIISEKSTNAFVKELSYVQNRKFSEILGLGYTKTGAPVAVANTNLQAAIQKMHTEPLIMKIEAGMAYAVLETDSAVEAVEVTGEGMHPSYPFQIRLKDSSKSVKVKFLEKPQNPVQGKIYDLSKDVDFNVSDYFDNENSYKNIRDKIFPTSGVSQPVILNGNKSKINSINEAYKNILDESQLKERAKRKKENEKALSGYSKERSQMTTKERSQLKEQALESDSVEQPTGEPSQGNTPQEKNKIAKIKSAKDLFVFLKETFVKAREFTKSTGLAYTETQKNIRSFLEAMNSQLSRTAFRVRLQGRMLRKLADSPEKLKLVEDYLVAEPNEKQAIREQIEKLEKGSKILAVADGMRSYIDSMSEKFLNSPYFDSLPEVASKKVESYVVQKGKDKGKTKYRVVNTKTGEVLAADLTKAAAEKQQQQAGIKDIIRNNLGSYLHTSYRFFSDNSFKITDKSKKAAIQGQYEAVRAEKIKELMDDGMTEKEAIESLKDPKLITEMQELATKQIEDYIRKIEEVRADPKFKVLGLNAASAKIPKPAFQRKKGLPDYIENMLGIEKDPVNRFVNSALVMAQTFYKAQLVHKISQSVGEDYVKDSITDAEAASGNWKLVKDKYSPLGGKYVQVEIFEMLQSKPLLSSDNAFFDGYFKALKLMRKSKVIWNIPTWRKNWTGGWFFMAANGVINKRFAQDTKNRAERLLKGMSNPEIEALLDEMAENGLIGADVNAGLIDLNDAAMGMMFSDEDLGTIEAKYKKLFNKMKNADSKLAEKYASVDDYSKLIIYRVERESFAKKLFGKKYSELTEKQQAQVRKEAAEFVKQNTPTFSRLPKWYTRGRVAGKEISFAQLPLGDFLGFKLESIRSLFTNIRNAAADLKKARTDTSLNEAQKAEYKAAGQRRMAGSMSVLAMRMAIPLLFAKMALDEEDEELQDDAVRLRPTWMEGHTLLVKSISDEGVVRVYDYSMEDPYAEVIDMTTGDLTIFEDFTKPNMLVKLLTHLSEGKDAYGKDLYEKADPRTLKMAKSLGYTMKQFVVPPSLSALAKYKNPSQMAIRDYEINVGQQFYFQAKEYVSTKKYYEMEGRARENRLRALDEVREMYEAVMNIAIAKNNT